MPAYFAPIYNTVVGIIIGALVGWITGISKNAKEKKKSDIAHSKNIDAGIAILLRAQLVAYYTAYQHADSINADDWKDIQSIYDVYKALGGNHTGDRIFRELEHKHLEIV